SAPAARTTPAASTPSAPRSVGSLAAAALASASAPSAAAGRVGAAPTTRAVSSGHVIISRPALSMAVGATSGHQGTQCPSRKCPPAPGPRSHGALLRPQSRPYLTSTGAPCVLASLGARDPVARKHSLQGH